MKEPGAPCWPALTLQASLLSGLCGMRKEKTLRGAPQSSTLPFTSWQLVTTV